MTFLKKLEWLGFFIVLVTIVLYGYLPVEIKEWQYYDVLIYMLLTLGILITLVSFIMRKKSG